MRIFYSLIFIMGCLLDIGDQTVPLHGHRGIDERAFRIKPQACADRNNVQGVCMFQWECRQRKGNMLATCLDRFLFGTCCKLPTTNSSLVALLTDSGANSTDNGSATVGQYVNKFNLAKPLPSGLPNDTVTTPEPFSTPDVEKIFHHFLGSVLSNYSDPVNNTVTEEYTFQAFINETTPFTVSGTYSEETSTSSKVTLPETVTYSETTNTVDHAEGGTHDYEEESNPNEVETTTIGEISNNVSSSFPTLLSTSTSSSVEIVETPVSVNDSHNQENEDETTVANDDYYDTNTDVIHSDEDNLSKTTETSTSTTIATTTETPITNTVKHFDYKKDEDTRFLFSSWSWASLVHGLLALPALIRDWLTGSNVADECFGALACEPQTSTTDSAYSYLLPNEAYCGVRPLIPNGRIVGGTDSRFGEWPWQVLIKEATWLGLFVKNKCGGVLLNQRYVVTAAHCQPGFLASLLVIFGENDLSVNDKEMKPVQRNVRRTIVHRKYNALTFDNDLALLELERPVDYHPHIVPICLPPDDEDFTGRTAVVSGWGRIKYGGRLPTDLQYVEVPIMTNSKCQQMFLSAGHIKVIGNKFICAGYQEGAKDSCEGDSGGPLVLQGDDGRWILVGTVSHGIKCAYPNLPGVYIKISAYKSWIEKIVNN